jgi:hypothetical protein
MRLRGRVEGPGGLADFLREREGAEFCGPILLGESPTPVGARVRFPALELPGPTRLVGTQPLVWRGAHAVDVLVLTSRSARKMPDDRLSAPLLEPALFHLALRAAGDWLGERAFRVHVGHEEGIASFTYLRGDAPPDEARAYLAALAADFLDRSGFDLLPFELIVSLEELRAAYSGAEDLGAEDYARRLREAVEADAEKDYPEYRPVKLLEITEPEVPDDALVKVRRRFRPLDRGPARAREGDA